MATFYYSQNQTPPAPPAYILRASAATSADSKWYDFNRTWGEYAQQWENYFGFSKKPSTGDKPSNPVAGPVVKQIFNKLPATPDDLPYDHAFPFGVDPNDPSKPYAPYGFYCDENGNPTTTPCVESKAWVLQYGLLDHPDDTDKESPLNIDNIDSPMDPYNMNQFFYAEKPGSPWHQYERQPDQAGAGVGYINYNDYPRHAFKDTLENFPWLHDQDPSHHYRNGGTPSYSTMVMPTYSTMVMPTYSTTIIDIPVGSVMFDVTYPNITEKIYLDSPVAPAGWQEVIPPANNPRKVTENELKNEQWLVNEYNKEQERGVLNSDDMREVWYEFRNF